jgi:hypothetical protein
MPRPKKETIETDSSLEQAETKQPTPNDIEWTDYVLSLLSDDEKIMENPTTDGLRRIFEIALNCTIIESISTVVQSPDPHNEKRATVTHSLTYVLNQCDLLLKKAYLPPEFIKRTVTGSADVYWGNCDRIYRNHPVAVAETRAEGRALRRALKLRKVVAAEELAKDIEDHPDHDTVTKITNNQLNFMDVLAKRLDINMTKLLEKLALPVDNLYNISYSDAVDIVTKLTQYQQQNNVSEDILGYESNWK